MPHVGPASRQRGFVLIIVFLVVLLLVALGGAVLLSTQSDLQVAGRDRESATALYAAEAGVAYAQDWLASRASGTGAGAWTALLRSGDPRLCARGSGASPGIEPQATNPAVGYDTARHASYRFCIHNNALDTRYFEDPPTGDIEDGDGIIAIEAYGFGAGGARVHVTVELPPDAQAPATSDYTQAGGGGLKRAEGEITNPIQNVKGSF